MNEISPFCPNCNRLLKKDSQGSEKWEFYNCGNCKYGEAKNIKKWLPTNDETNELFYEVAKKLMSETNISVKEALDYTEEFYLKFTNKEYCEIIGTSIKDDDFFHGELFQLLFYISYFIIDKKEPNMEKFQEWYFKNR